MNSYTKSLAVKFPLYLVFQIVSLLLFSQLSNSKGFINPTGTYTLSYEIEVKEVFGPFGEVRVKLLDGNKVAISLFVCRGAPNYNNGSFIDTLVYTNNRAIHKTENDSSCAIIFTFKRNKVEIEQKQANLNFGCDFGQRVFADGVYDKVSNKIPLITDIDDEYFPIEKLLTKQQANTTPQAKQEH
jgi:hypothetical protein